MNDIIKCTKCEVFIEHVLYKMDCLHSFCQPCIKQMTDSKTLNCPICKCSFNYQTYELVCFTVQNNKWTELEIVDEVVNVYSESPNFFDQTTPNICLNKNLTSAFTTSDGLNVAVTKYALRPGSSFEIDIENIYCNTVFFVGLLDKPPHSTNFDDPFHYISKDTFMNGNWPKFWHHKHYFYDKRTEHTCNYIECTFEPEDEEYRNIMYTGFFVHHAKSIKFIEKGFLMWDTEEMLDSQRKFKVELTETGKGIILNDSVLFSFKIKKSVFAYYPIFFTYCNGLRFSIH